MLVTILFFLLGSFTVQAQSFEPLSAGVAITDNTVVRKLEDSGLGIGTFMHSKSVKPGNSELAASPLFAAIVQSLRAEMSDYQEHHVQGVGVGMAFGKRLFDLKFLTSPAARFALVGVVSRMDRAFVPGEDCGETRLIYRLAYAVSKDGKIIQSRLPMTINLVLAARPVDRSLSCQDIARRWQKFVTVSKGDPTLAAKALLAADGPLAAVLVSPKQVLQLETNLQIVRWPAVIKPDFGGHAEYLLKVYKTDGKTYHEVVLENQIDRERMLEDADLLKRFRAYLSNPQTLQALDDGTVIIPEEFLAKRAFSTAPGGLSRSANRPTLGLVDDDFAAQILTGTSLTNIKSVAGLQRRLTDVSCSGCHQTRAIGGFHFMGQDPLRRYIGNSVYAAGSPHFFSDLVRRKDITTAFATGQAPDFRKGFSSRPPTRPELEGSGLLNGWGSVCSVGHDPSFVSWTCQQPYKCKVIESSAYGEDLGICLFPNGDHAGEPQEAGVVTSSAFGADKYLRTELFPILDATHFQAEPQSATPGNSTGGFPGSMLHYSDCHDLPAGEAACGLLPGSKPGFNRCLTSNPDFVQCLHDFSSNVGLRACDATHPCREDYICAESTVEKSGVCVPPYFLFQFRVDGHPVQ